MNGITPPPRARLFLAFSAIYIIWGSSYLGIRVAIETIPPFLMAGVRFVIAGAILYVLARARGAAPPARGHWPPSVVLGTLLLVGGNGTVVWAEQWLPSGLTSLIVSLEPIWIVILLWLGPRRARPEWRVVFGMLWGFAGAALFVSPAELVRGPRVDITGALVLIGGSVSWACGALYSRGAKLPASAPLATAMQMLAGGAILLALGNARGEWRLLNLAGVSHRSLVALVYLIVFAGVITFTAFIWLLRVTSPAVVATHGFVNPVVAVFLGWALAGEPVTPRTILASAVIVSAVALVVTARGGEPAAEIAQAGEEPRAIASRSPGEV